MREVDMSLDEFRKLPLLREGESKEIRGLENGECLIYFKPTIYSFTANRCAIIEGSNVPRIKSSMILCELLKKNGINHSYLEYGEELVKSKWIENPPNIEIVVKANHTGTSRHKYFGMNTSRVRKSHKLYKNMIIEDMQPYPELLVRFDWRNPFYHPETHQMLADEVLGDMMADWFIDVNKARQTVIKTYNILSDFLNEHDIVIYDLCLFITEDGETVFGEISPDCGRFRHYDLGSLDKDVWRAGGSSKEVLEKWNLLYEMIK